MTQICAICISLLKGDILTIGDGFYKLNCTNLPIELSRSVEKKFGVTISRDKKEFKSKYDEKPGYYFRYRLNRTDANAKGIKRMQEYIQQQTAKNHSPKTEKEVKAKRILDQINLF